MAQDINSRIVSSSIRGFFARNNIFRFLKLGPLCNAASSITFQDARCDIKLLRGEEFPDYNPRRLWYGIPMKDLFDNGFQALERQINSQISFGTEEQKNALSTLTKFISEIGIHEKNIIKIMETMDSKAKSGNDDTLFTIAVAEHLLNKLSPGKSYLIDSRLNDTRTTTEVKDLTVLCQCGCGKDILFGHTGIGHSEVWHGHVDIILMSPENTPENIANVFIDFNPSTAPPKAKRAELTDEFEEEEEENEDGPQKRDMLDSVRDQMIAQTIVFGLYCKKKYECKCFIPNILIGKKSFYVVMYDPDSDVLLWSEQFILFSQSKLQISSVIALWMLLHFKLFCESAKDIFENIKELQCGFKEQVEKVHQTYYEQIDICVASFNNVKHVDLAKSLCEESDILIPKLKKRRTY